MPVTDTTHFPPSLGADLGKVGISTCKLPVRNTATYWSWPFELATDLFSDFQLIHMRLEIESLQILFIVDMQVWRNANMKLLQGIYIAVCTVLRCWKLSNSSSAQSNILQAVYTENSKRAVQYSYLGS